MMVHMELTAIAAVVFSEHVSQTDVADDVLGPYRVVYQQVLVVAGEGIHRAGLVQREVAVGADAAIVAAVVMSPTTIAEELALLRVKFGAWVGIRVDEHCC
ncbi:unnamed protein product [Urochloa humidicola]